MEVEDIGGLESFVLLSLLMLSGERQYLNVQHVVEGLTIILQPKLTNIRGILVSLDES
jgi:hypothetical protein